MFTPTSCISGTHGTHSPSVPTSETLKSESRDFLRLQLPKTFYFRGCHFCCAWTKPLTRPTRQSKEKPGKNSNFVTVFAHHQNFEVDMEDPQLLHQFRGVKDCVTRTVFHPSKLQVAASSLDSNISIWTFYPDNVKAYRYSGHTNSVLDLCYSPSGHLLGSASKDRTVRLWTTRSLQGESNDFRGHQAPVRSIDFSPCGTKLLTASDDKTIKMWTVERQKFMASFATHTNWVRSARFSPRDPNLIASVSDDKSLKLYDVQTGKEIKSFNENKGYAQHLSFHPSGSFIGIGTSDQAIKIYDIRMMKLHQLYNCHEGPVSQVSFHPSGNYLLSGSKDEKMKMIDLLEARPIYDLVGHTKPVTSVQFSSKGEYFVSGAADQLVFVWKTNFSSTSMSSVMDVEKSNVKNNSEERRILADKVKKSLKLNSNTSSDEDNENIPPLLTKKQSESLLLDELKKTNSKLESLTQTLVLMDKRMTLVEEQLKLLSQNK